MLGMFTKKDNEARLDRLNARISELHRKPSRTEYEEEELGEAETAAAEIQQWLRDLSRAEGGP